MIPYKSTFINYADEGSGPVVVLLHGYLETLDIWGTFAEELSKTFRVITMDIPGHGKSGKISEIHTVDILAEALEYLLHSLHISKAFFIGHSMGGYTVLSYLARNPMKVSGICLFHSTPFADTEQKKVARSQEIELVREGKLKSFIPANVVKSFATDNLERLKDKVEWAEKIAFQNKPEGIIALLDEISDQAHDRYGIAGLLELDAEEGPADDTSSTN